MSQLRLGTQIGGNLAWHQGNLELIPNIDSIRYKNLDIITSKGGQTIGGSLTATQFIGAVVGNASTSTRLQTARTINGTSFNGSANITTVNWGTARNVTVGNTAKSVNGSANVAWTLDEIGAVNSSPIISSNNDEDVIKYITTNGRNSIIRIPNTYPLLNGHRVVLNLSASGNGGMQIAARTIGNELAVRSIGDNGTGTWSRLYNDDYHPFAEKFKTSRKINETNFDGSADIITNRWGVARSVSVNGIGKLMDGTGNVSWNVQESTSWYHGMCVHNTPAMLLVAKKYIDTSVTASGFVGTIMVGRNFQSDGSTLNISSSASVHVYCVHSENIIRLIDKTTQRRDIQLVDVEYEGETWVAVYITQHAGSAQVHTVGKFYSDPIFISDATGYVISNVIDTPLTYSSNYKPAPVDINAIDRNGDTVFGDMKFNGGLTVNTDSDKFPFTIGRHRTITDNEQVKHSVLDTEYLIHYKNDESTSQIRFVLENTDTETNSGANASESEFVIRNTGGNAEMFLDGSKVYNDNYKPFADQLTTARTINGTSFNGSANITTANWGTARNVTIGKSTKSVNGGANVSWTLAEIGAVSIDDKIDVKPGPFTGTYKMIVNVPEDALYEIANVTYNGTSNVLTAPNFSGNGSALTSLNATNLASGTVPVARLSGSYTINASTATTLQTARTINGTSFNGSANITTANWGTARNLTIGNTAKSVNGSANVAWTLAEIGAANATATVNLTGNQTIAGTKTFSSAIVGSLSGNATTATTLQTARTINGTSFNGSANIITSIWGSGRDVTIGDTAKSVNGSANVAWTRSDIGVPRTTNSTSVGIENTESCVAYVQNVLLGANDGALYSHVYSDSWKHQIQGDYRTGQIAIRGKNNGTWQSWRTVIDSLNYTSILNPVYVNKTGDTITGQLRFESAPLHTGNVAQIFHDGRVPSGGILVARSMRENTAATWIWEKVSSGSISYSIGTSGSGLDVLRFGINPSRATISLLHAITPDKNFAQISHAPSNGVDKSNLLTRHFRESTTSEQVWEKFSDSTIRYSTGTVGSGPATILFDVKNGNITASGNITGFSDISIKKNIERIPDSLKKVKQLSGYTFDRTDIDCPRQTGVIAQEVQKVLPEAVLPQIDGKLTVAYGNLVGLLIEAIKELNEKVESLEKERNKSLIDKVKDLF